MRKLWPLLLLVFFVAACDNPVEPSSVDSDDDINILNIINIGGDHDHEVKPDPDPDEPDDVQNRPPVLILPQTQTSDVGDSVSVDIAASDPDGDTVQIAFDAQSAPRDCTITPTGDTSARLSCVISSSSPNDSPFTVRVTGDDNRGGSTTGFFIWIVNTPEEV